MIKFYYKLKLLAKLISFNQNLITSKDIKISNRFVNIVPCQTHIRMEE